MQLSEFGVVGTRQSDVLTDVTDNFMAAGAARTDCGCKEDAYQCHPSWYRLEPLDVPAAPTNVRYINVTSVL